MLTDPRWAHRTIRAIAFEGGFVFAGISA